MVNGGITILIKRRLFTLSVSIDGLSEVTIKFLKPQSATYL